MMFAVVMLLLANLPAYSAPADSADADYCIDFNGELPRLIFEKKNNDLKPILLDMRRFSKFVYYYSNTSTNFKFTAGRETCDDFYTQATLNGYMPKEISELPQVIQADFPPKSEFIAFVEGRRKKEELLLFKDQVIDASIEISINNGCLRCLPNLDTTFNIPFRARITGECKK
jgi:hypothetical protein